MTNIFGLNLTELTSLITDLNLPKFRAKQIIEWLYQKHATSFDEMTNLSKDLREKLAQEFTIERVLKECRKELVGEGQIFFDYLRNKQSIVRKGGWHLSTLNTLNAETIQPNDPRIALPIPQSEIDANPNIVQNPQ